MQHHLPQSVAKKLRPILAVGLGLCIVLFGQGFVWSGSTRVGMAPTRWDGLQVAFTDKEHDFVPPPPRDDTADEGDVAKFLFDNPEPVEARLDDGTDDPFPQDRPQEDLQFHEPVAEHPLPLAPQRDHFDPGFPQYVCATDTWQVMPAGLMYRSYLAGEKESRMSSVWTKDHSGRTVWENTLGGRLGLLRHGTTGAHRPQGWQLDLEGAALARVLPGTESTMLEACDYRAGIQSTWAFDRWHIKAGYYHLSSHLGDEFLLANPLFTRRNYVRDSTVAGVTYDISDDWQTYGEIAYALGAEDGAEPLEFQYGFQFCPPVYGLRGAPFAAINGHTRQDFDYVTSVNCQAGWQWRGTESQHLWRMGMQYYSGPALQYSFPGRRDHLLGGGLWLDF